MKTSLGERLVLQFLTWLCFSAVIMASPSRADVLERGQLAVTQFSGLEARQDGTPASSIDPDGASFVTLDVGVQGNKQLVPRIRIRIPAGEIGQVFGIALDDGQGTGGRSGPPNIYLTATSAFGLRISAGDAALTRGRPDAVWMRGQFGTEKGGGPGAVWKIDGPSGELSLLTTIRPFGIETGAASLGAVAFDPASRMLYISDLQSGFIHRIDPNGTDFGYFDHGVEGRVLAGQKAVAPDPNARRDATHPQFEPQNPASWGFSVRERMVYGLAVHKGRLYYAAADGPQIWSVGLNPDGSFGGDARAEITQTGTAAESIITELAFDAAGMLYAAERVLPGLEAAANADGRNPSAVRRFTLASTADGSGSYWVPVEDRLPGGIDADGLATSGGLAFGYGHDANGVPDVASCGGSLWLTLRPARLSPGAVQRDGQAISSSLQRFALPAAAANEALASLAADDGATVPDRLGIAVLGLVKAYAPCPQAVAQGADTLPGQPSAETLSSGPLLFLEQSCKPCPVGGSCTCRVNLVNSGRDTPKGMIGFRSAATILSGPRAGQLRGVRQSSPDGAQWNCNWLNTGEYECRIDGDSLRPGAQRSVDLLIDTRELVEGGNFGLQNCAKLLLDNGEREGQRACAETGLDIAIAESGPRRCVAGQPCLSQTTVTNLTSSPFDGIVKLTHFVAVPGKGNLAGSIAITPPVECQPAALASPLECTTRLSLAPGESRTYEVAMTLLGDGGSAAIKGILCATATDNFLDISMLLPGIPPVPLAGPGYHCRPFRLLPEGSPGPGGSASAGGQGAGTNGGGAGQGVETPGQTAQGGTEPVQSGNGGNSATSEASGGSGAQCPAGTISEGTQCACPRGSKWGANSCVADNGDAAQGGPGCANGGTWNGVSCAPPATGSGGSNSSNPGGGSPPTAEAAQCRPPFQRTAKGCACPERTMWTGLRCAPATDYESPQDYGGLAGGNPAAPLPGQPTGPAPSADDDTVDYGATAGPPCPDGQVRDASGKCVCPPYLDQVVENGQQICCLVPCPPGMKRENAQCVPAAPPVQTVLECPDGWAGQHPTCCPPPQTYANGRCVQPAATPAQTPVPVPAPAVLKCPDGWSGVHPTCCQPGLAYVNGRCETPAPVSCENGMVGTPPNCACASGTELRGGRCVPIICPAGTSGVYPVCCPEPARYVNGRCERPAAPPRLPECRNDMEGTPPNCRCPQGTQDNGRRCERIPRPQCRSDMAGTPPNCFCPEGTRDDGRRCVRIQRPECRGDMIGTPPNCRCPQGTQDNGNRCVTRACNPGWSGVFPNCCPPGTNFVNGRCERPAAPPPPLQGCQRGMVGSPPNCACPPGTYFSRPRGRCVPQGDPSAQPQNCPPGTYFSPPRGRCVPQGEPSAQPQNCPPGTYFSRPRGRCVPQGEPSAQPQNCPPGTYFSRPRGRCVPQGQPSPQAADCPPGYRKLDRPNRYGAFCEIISTPGPTAPPPPKCPLQRTCVEWGKAPPGALAGPCIRYEMRPNCPAVVR